MSGASSGKFVGRPDNVEALTALYAWVINQIKDIARTERRAHFDTTGEHIDPLRWQVSFGEGAVERLIVRLREMKARQQEDMSHDEYGNVTALSIHHAGEASDYLEVKYGYRKDGKRTKKEQESLDRYNQREEARVLLKAQCEAAGDMEPYYTQYEWERPDTPEETLARAKWNEEYLKKQARKARRRTGGGGREAKVDERKEDQSYTARASGREASSRVNLQPFIAGATERKKVS